ncbi:MAG: DUF2520 domain-containing protein [Chitinophagaceae bacterium]|nr:DUF2520 domain-containing protein [Chitinophagaceae bacterium]
MKVVIVGSGNVATVLGKKMKESGVDILQVISQTYTKALELGTALNVPATDNYGELNTGADIYLLAVTDNSIATVAAQLPELHSIVVHTAGSVSKDVLQGSFGQYGVIYPLQTLNRQISTIPEVPVMVDGNTEVVKETLKKFAKTWAEQVVVANDQQRLTTHVAAVIVNNFTNHLMALTEDFCMNEGIDFSLLFPLINQTVNSLGTMPAARLQTGPAERGDISIIDKHLQLLNRYPALRNLYLKLSESIIIHKRKNSMPDI